MTVPTLYNADFYKWSQEQAQLLRLGRFDQIDRENIIAEIEDMGKRERRELRNRLSVLFTHLLKWLYQPNLQGKSWMSTIKIQRFEINELIEENPSLKHALDDLVERAWKSALLKAEHETGMDSANFPKKCPWRFETFMDNGFWPGLEATGQKANG